MRAFALGRMRKRCICPSLAANDIEMLVLKVTQAREIAIDEEYSTASASLIPTQAKYPQSTECLHLL